MGRCDRPGAYAAGDLVILEFRVRIRAHLHFRHSVLDSTRLATFTGSMKLLNASISLGIALLLCSCFGNEIGYHRVKVGWVPGYENVPDCKPLIVMQGKSYDISGVSVPVPQAGTTITAGGVKVDPKALQTASDAAIRADQAYTRLCSLLPAYANNQVAFYKARDQMFELIVGTQQVAAIIATTTGQTPPAAAPSVPTAAPDAAKKAGADTTKAVANTGASPAPVPKVATTDQPPKKASAAQNEKIKRAGKRLKQTATKKLAGS
jgi:hypothetical protein